MLLKRKAFRLAGSKLGYDMHKDRQEDLPDGFLLLQGLRHPLPHPHYMTKKVTANRQV